jgi:hypothetical protein
MKADRIKEAAAEPANHILLPVAVGAVFLVALVLGAILGS